MKHSIIFLVALMLVAGGAFGQSLGGKLEFESSIRLDENVADGAPIVSSPELKAETNLTAAVDDFNAVTIEFREGLGTVFTSASPSGTENNSASYGNIFVTSDLGGALGLTELTGGLNLKYKGGWYKPDLREVGELKDIIQVSDVINEQPNGGWKEAHSRNLGSNFTIGWQDFVNLDVGLLLASNRPDGKNTDLLFSVFGAIPAGPGTFEYLVFFVETAGDKVLGDPDSGQVGGGLAYKDIAITEDISLGVGAEGYYDLQRQNWGVGVNVVADIFNWLDIDLDFGARPAFLEHRSDPNQESMQQIDLGVGLNLTDPSELMGLTFEAGIQDLGMVTDMTIDPRLEAGLFIKPGAAKFTVGWIGASLGVTSGDNQEQHTVYLTSVLSY